MWRTQQPRVTAANDPEDRPEGSRDFFKAAYGSTIAVYRAIADDPDKVAALDRALADLARDAQRDDGVMDWKYLLVTVRRRA